MVERSTVVPIQIAPITAGVVGNDDAAEVGDDVGAVVDGLSEGTGVEGLSDGAGVDGLLDGANVGVDEGDLDGVSVGVWEGLAEGDTDGEAVGCLVMLLPKLIRGRLSPISPDSSP